MNATTPLQPVALTALAAFGLAVWSALHQDSTSSDVDEPTAAAPIRIRHFAADDSVFIDDEYLIRGVAGAILWKLVGELIDRGRTEFTARELRLAGRDLRLPELQDNLSARVLLLQRRLEERAAPLRIERVGRGRIRLVAKRPLVRS